MSSALDVETERLLWDRLLTDANRTLLVVSNRPATIARADQVIHLEHGRVQPGSASLEAAEPASIASWLDNPTTVRMQSPRRKASDRRLAVVAMAWCQWAQDPTMDGRAELGRALTHMETGWNGIGPGGVPVVAHGR